MPGSSRSSATSSAESLYSTVSSGPRLRKLSAAEDVAARVRARWAALEALEKANQGQQAADKPTTTSNATGGTSVSIFGRRWRSSPEREREAEPVKGREPESEKDKENAVPMQVDGYEKPLPLPPRPAAPALGITSPVPMPVFVRATTMRATETETTAPTLMVVDVCSDSKDGDKDKNSGDDDPGPAPPPPHSDAGPLEEEVGSGPGAEGGADVPARDSTLRTTPTSLTFVESESLRPILQRRPARAVTPPQVRRRPSITDELEEAVSPPPRFPFIFFITHNTAHFAERRGYDDYAA
jgi:hypothetical protein